MKNMYKIMIADDEGIVIDALRFIIEKNFKGECMIESAKTGRQVIELADQFRPDIAFIDIQMPGISGIKAMQEIRQTNKNVIFIVVSAYDKFDYAREAINLSVMEYINKPIEQTKIVSTLKRAMELVDEKHQKRNRDLMIQEKLETVLPIIENGMIYSMLFQANFNEETQNYKNLLGIETAEGYMMVLRFGDALQDGKLTNAIGTSVKAQSFYQTIRETIKDFFPAVVGAMMGNSVMVMVPEEKGREEYEQRIEIIERAREMVRKLRKSIGVQFRVGIGSICPLEEIGESYREAVQAFQYSTASVSHAKDFSLSCEYTEDYPIDIENRLFDAVERGDVSEAGHQAGLFFDWMCSSHPAAEPDIQLKVLEVVLWAEHIAYSNGGMTYQFLARHHYLGEVTKANNYDELKQWFLSKIKEASYNVSMKKKKQEQGTVDMAKQYIREHYRNVSLDDISREVNISPYYFSKLFKEETGMNFIDYVTDVKIQKAKELLQDSKKSMKEICVDIGYANPNYFSHIFKKKMGVTPSEYKEKKSGMD